MLNIKELAKNGHPYHAKNHTMKKLSIITLLFSFILTSCNLNQPLDYYNQAVGAGNSSLTFFEMENRIERLESGMNLDTVNLVHRVSQRIGYNESSLAKLNTPLGNEDSDALIKSSIAYLQFDIKMAKDPQIQKVLEIVGDASTFEELGTNLSPYNEFLDSVYEEKEELYTNYDFEVVQFAKKHDIKIETY